MQVEKLYIGVNGQSGEQPGIHAGGETVHKG